MIPGGNKFMLVKKKLASKAGVGVCEFSWLGRLVAFYFKSNAFGGRVIPMASQVFFLIIDH